MNTEVEPESRLGWDGTFVFVGDFVRVRKAGFGKNCKATVLKLGEPTGTSSMCEIRIDSIGKNASGWETGNRLDICSGWLQATKF